MAEEGMEMSAKKTPSVCMGCAHAEWDKTATGRLSPDGMGWCRWSVSVPLPSSMPSWGIPSKSLHQGVYTLKGGRIDRWKRSFTIGEGKPCPVKEPAQ